jgi:ubiquinone/menaquinone biosynthesis C-methylase UbiE
MIEELLHEADERFPLLRQFIDDYPLEVVLRYFRINAADRETPGDAVLLDIGCGRWCYFLRRARKKIKKGFGFDAHVDYQEKSKRNLEIKNFEFKDSLPYESNFFDAVTMIAVFEHFNDVNKLISETSRVLKPKGTAIVTFPAKKSKLTLNILASLRILNPKEIFSHKRYLTTDEAINLFKNCGFKLKKLKHFELGYNHLYVFEKQTQP